MKSNIPPNPPLGSQIAAVRGFSRFYTRKLGIIEPKLLDSPWTLQEARIIYEIAERKNCTATDLVRALGLDAGFLSRTLQAMQRRRIVARKPSKADRRVTELSLTAKGRAAFADLDSRSRGVVGALLGRLDAGERAAIINAMATIEHTLEAPARAPASFLLRSHRPGDIGWIVSRHGALYAQEYGWDITFEALAAEIAAQFIRSYDPSRSTAGSRKLSESRSARSFWSRPPTRSRNCACYWWRKRREGSGSDARSPRSASASRKMRAIHRSRCGPRASSSPRAEFISAPDFAASAKRSTIVSASISSARPGS
jgi:DNA-binding MarR family transcriptional regulator